jgi:hypothetical protein
MQQNQNNQEQGLNDINQPGLNGPSEKFGQRQGINPGFVHPPADGDVDTEDVDKDVDEIPGQHHIKEGQHEFKEPTFEQQRWTADQHEHPHTGASFPKQDPAKGPDGKPVSNGKVY